jgi:hypothetical protein
LAILPSFSLNRFSSVVRFEVTGGLFELLYRVGLAMSDEPADQRPELYYFCDESSFLGEDYMAVSGVAVARNSLGTVVKDILAINDDKRARGDGWMDSNRVTAARLERPLPRGLCFTPLKTRFLADE